MAKADKTIETPISKHDPHDAQTLNEATTRSAENNSQYRNKARDMNEVQVKTEPGTEPGTAGTGNEEDNGLNSEESSDSGTEGEHDSDFECSEDESEIKPRVAKTPAKKPSRNRAAPAKTAREFIARLHRKQDDAVRKKQKQSQNKRKAEATDEEASKRPKTINASSGSDLFASLTHPMFGGFDDGGPPAPAMPEIDAHTHQKQFALLRDSIPKGADTRRTKTQHRDLREAAKLFGYKKVKATSGNWLLQGMETPLYGYQLTAAAWMLKRECDRAQPLGGMIADEMGIGKTITSLACVVGNPPEAEDLKTYTKGTLVIVPNVSIANQWREEVKKHCGDDFGKTVMIHQSKNQAPAVSYQNLMIVITTTNEVLAYYRRLQSGKKHEDEVLGFNWYRIILDEAHSIKNLKSLTKQSMCTLKAKHRWALTGTPLSNSATGFEVEERKKCFAKEYMDKNKANKKLEALISSFMYRRTQRDTFLGHQIVPIPRSETHDIWVPLTVEEEAIYIFMKKLSSSDMTESDDEQDKTESEKEVVQPQQRKRHMSLRHLISHPYNIERLLRNFEEAAQIQELRDSIRQVTGTQTVLQQILSQNEAKESLERYKSGLTQMRTYTNTAFGGIFKFDEHLAAVQDELKLKDMECIKCQSSDLEMPMIIPKCDHIYCGHCYDQIIQSTRLCKTPNEVPLTCVADGCNMPFKSAKKLKTMSAEVDEALKLGNYPDTDDNKVTLARKKDQIGFFISSYTTPGLSMVPNSRLTTAMAVLLSWRADYPDDKIIVFTLNVTTAKVLGSMLKHARIGFVYYFGSMGDKKKKIALEMFKKSPTTNVFLSGLMAGGQSLNITCANRIIIIDPWWNVTSELQAAGRTSRIGQTKKCYVVRIFTSAATDARVAELQKSKSEEVDHALQDDGHVPQELDYQERLELFERTRG
ncbi:SNF2 family domain-containing protein, partial [Metarhizium brunneum ARSEF 3297]